MVYRILPANQTRIACEGGIPAGKQKFEQQKTGALPGFSFLRF